ncbi:MAG: glycoside hydrolase family 15 protein [Thermoleophilaceae bacterium]
MRPCGSTLTRRLHTVQAVRYRSRVTGASPFPPIRDYAFLSDCEACALVAPGGGVEWLCLPRPDSPSVFGALLDRSAGTFALAPAGTAIPSHRRYLPGSLVLETTWQTPTGWLLVHDCLVMRRRQGGKRSERYRRAPADFTAEGVLLRIATCIDGEVEVVLDCLPQFDYGREASFWSYSGEGYDQARVQSAATEVDLRLTTNLQLGLTAARAYGHTALTEGNSVFGALSWGDGGPASVDEAYERAWGTSGYWRGWLKGGSFPDHEWRSYLERSALTLKGLSYAPTGAILAAATTSLPETPGGERNWDYRFTWVRDSAFMLWGLLTLGFEWEAYEFFAFLVETAGQGPLQIMYGIDGERELHERTLDHLSGYDGARPVRIGNGAWDQRQHDVWGMLVDSVAIHSRHRLGRQLPAAGWELLAGLVEGAAANWREADRGIWEVRGDPKHFTASKVLCWVALDRGARMAEERGDADRAREWRRVADEIQAEVCERGVDGRGVFVQHYETEALDASLLLIPLMGFLGPEDERVRATVLAIADDLTQDGLVLRYRVQHTDDGLEGEEGTFTICSFWLVSALTRIGEVERARALCEKLLAFASPLGLYAEEIDARSGRHLGNFPQAFTHLALINAVMGVIEAERTRE